ncbi:hypothetical protein U3516DRAFT_764572 [Neocallimastix sp. 'constans']
MRGLSEKRISRNNSENEIGIINITGLDDEEPEPEPQNENTYETIGYSYCSFTCTVVYTIIPYKGIRHSFDEKFHHLLNVADSFDYNCDATQIIVDYVRVYWKK